MVVMPWRRGERERWALEKREKESLNYSDGLMREEIVELTVVYSEFEFVYQSFTFLIEVACFGS